MTGLLKYLGIDFNQLIVLILVLVFSAIAIKVSISFDINDFLKSRREARLDRLRSACTHHEVIKEGDQYGLQSLFISPPGTVQWQCQRCGTVRYFGDDELVRMTKYWLEHFDEYTNQEKKFEKLLKKSGLS